MISTAVKKNLSSFPLTGVDVHLSLAEALAQGINPGEPAVIEATVRPFAVGDWVAEGGPTSAAAAHTMIRWPAGVAPSMIRWHADAQPAPGRGPASPSVLAALAGDLERITWRPAPVVATAPAERRPAGSPPERVAGAPDRISWRSGGSVFAA